MTTDTYDQRPKRRDRVRAEMMILGLEGAALERDQQPYGTKGSTMYQSATEGRSTMPAALVAALKRHEPPAFEQLLAQHGATLFRVASALLGQPQEAEEVLQETWLRVYEKIHTFCERATLSTWLYRIVVNAAIMRLRARARSPEAQQASAGLADAVAEAYPREGAVWARPPEEALLRQELCMALQQGIDGLPEPYRTVYVWAEIEGQPHQELATALALTVGTVKTRLHRARRRLREVLMAEWGADGRRPGVDRHSRGHGHSLGCQAGIRAQRHTAPGASPHVTRIGE